MPRGDGTGPMGMGSMTGRAAGYCAGYAVPGFMNPYGGRGMGMAWGRGGGWGMGMGWRRGRGRGFWPGSYAAPSAPPMAAAPMPSAADELEMLRDQADWLKRQMDTIHTRIQEIEQEKD